VVGYILGYTSVKQMRYTFFAMGSHRYDVSLYKLSKLNNAILFIVMIKNIDAVVF
jgi:hypothetical protein